MDWLRLDAGFFEHHKHGRLSRRLGISRKLAALHVLQLFCWAAKCREDGDLTGVDPEDLAAACEYEGDPAEFLDALCDSGWVDKHDVVTTSLRLAVFSIHEWAEHNPLLGRRERDKKYEEKRQIRLQAKKIGPRRRNDVATTPTDVRTYVRTEHPPDACGELEKSPAPPPPDPRCPAFRVVGKGPTTWQATERQVSEWAAAFPALDVPGEIKRAHAWIAANPHRAKTTRGMPGFLVGWLNRSQDHGAGRTTAGAKAERNPRAGRWRCEKCGGHGCPECGGLGGSLEWAAEAHPERLAVSDGARQGDGPAENSD